MSEIKNITFAILAKNEEERIEFPIKNFLPYGEVIVFDDQSTDRTVEIAERLGAKVIQRKVKYTGNSETKDFTDHILSFIKTDWVFWGFADEMVPKTCLELFKKVSEENRYKVVVQKRKTLLYRHAHEYMPFYTMVKFFKKGALDFSGNKVHQWGKFSKNVDPSEVLFLPPLDEYSIYHFSNQPVRSFIEKYNNYTDMQSKFREGKNFWSDLIIRPFIVFFLSFLIYGNIRKGFEGLIISAECTIDTFLIGAKAYERLTGNTSSNIEKEFQKTKKKLLVTSPKSGAVTSILCRCSYRFLEKLYLAKKFRQKTMIGKLMWKIQKWTY